MMKVPQFMPFLDNREYEAIKDCFDKNWVTEGSKAKEFNSILCEIIEVKYGVFAPNGTLALYLALKSLNIGPGDEVIVPDFTFIASANAIQMVGAKPVFADINAELQIDINKCQSLVTQKTKAIMPVHIYGFTANMDDVIQFSNKNKLLIIEDAAQALGIKWDGKPCGSFGDVSAFSFFADKTLTTGEGGFVATNSKSSYEQLVYLRNQGRLNSGTFIHPEIGYNFRMTDIQMAIGLVQLKKMPQIVSNKQYIHKMYCELLKDVNEIEIIKPNPKVNPYIPFRVVLLTKNEKSTNLMAFMSENGIEPRTFFYPIHLQPGYSKKGIQCNYQNECPCEEGKLSDCEKFSNSIYAYEHGVCLPSFAALKEEEIIYVCDVIKKYFSEK